MSSRADETPQERWAEATEFVRDSKITLLSAVIAARAECPTGTPFRARISRHHPAHAFEVLFLAEDRKQVVRVEIDAICGEPLAADDDEPMPAKDIAALAVFAAHGSDALEASLRRAAKLNRGTPIGAELRERKKAPPIVAVTLLTPTGIREILVAPADERPVHLVRRSE
ncbi:MAG: hypothetical protein ACM3U2_22575 [Deltaproteobacteria bacterium]